MKRFWLVLLAVVGLVGGASAEPIKPVVEVRVKAVADLIPTVEYVGGLAGQADSAQQFAGVMKQFAGNEKGFDGLDLNRPIGFYAGFAEKVEDSPLVLMLPIADEEAAIDAAKTKLNVDLKKGDGGVYTAELPGVPGPVYLRFADKYAYITLRSEKWVDAGKLIAPKVFFAEKPTDVLGLSVRLANIPEDVKKMAYGQMELKVKEDNSNRDATPMQKLFNDFFADVSVDAVKTVLTDGDTFTLTLNVDPKADDWKLAVGLTPKAGTTLAKTLAGFADRESGAAGAAWVKNPLTNFGLNFQLPPETTKKFAALMDAAAKQAVQDAKESDRTVVEKAFDAALPTLKAGDFQIGVLGTPATGDKMNGLVTLKTVKGTGIVDLVKGFALLLPKEQGSFQADVGSVGERKLHKATFVNTGDNPFGSSTMWAMTSDDLIALAIAGESDSLKAVAAAKPTKTPMFFTETSFTRAAMFSSKDHTPEMIKKALADVFPDGKPDGKDTLKLVLSGGKKLELSLTMKGKGAAFLAALDRAKKGE